MTLEQLVPTLEVCQQLKAAGFPQDTMFVWTSRCGEPPEILSKGYAEDEWENGGGFMTLCAAPTAGELMDMIRAKHPDAEIISRCTWPGAAWVIHYGENGYKNTYGDTSIAALAALVLEVAG